MKPYDKKQTKTLVFARVKVSLIKDAIKMLPRGSRRNISTAVTYGLERIAGEKHG